MLTAFKPEEVERLFKETVYDGQRVIFKTHAPEQTQTAQNVVTFNLNIEDREEVVEETNGNFDPDVASMRSKMAEPEEEPEEEVPAIPLFQTPREIIDEYRAFERQAMETDNDTEQSDGTKTGTNGGGDAQGGANGDGMKTDDDDEEDDDSLKSQT